MQNEDTSWVDISKKAIISNIKELKNKTGKHVKMMPVLKSNAYGHDLIQIARFLTKNKINHFATASLNEALELRKNNIKCFILVLSFFNPTLLKKAIKQKIRLTVYGYQAAKKLDNIAKRIKSKAIIHIKIDTGTSRLGIRPEKIISEYKKICKLNNLTVEGVFSHLSDAENINQRITSQQNNIFKAVLDELNVIHRIKIAHLACSAALILNKKTHYDMVRPGISIYGLNSIQSTKNHYVNLTPILSWHTRIIQIKDIPKYTYVGYNQSYKTTKKTKIALIPIGYWDGYDRKLSNRSQVIIKGKRCNVIGNICMNLTIIDVTKLKELRTGDKVTLIGKQGNQEITADELAKIIGTINYEIVTRINPLIKRYLI